MATCTTLRSLSHMDLLRLTCGQCDHVREIPSRFMAVICGEDVKVSALAKRIKCSACGNNKGNKLAVLYGQVDQQSDYFTYREPDNLGKFK